MHCVMNLLGKEKCNLLYNSLFLVSCSFIEKQLDIKAYFQLDPLMVPLFVYLCPKDDLPVLCDHVPLYMVIAVICHTLESRYKIILKKFEVSIEA